jgi:hypothetical protein
VAVIPTSTSHNLPAKRTGGWVLAGAQIGFALWLAAVAIVAHYRTTSDTTSLLAFLLGTIGWMAVMLAGLSLIPSGLLLAVGYATGRPALLVSLVGGAVVALVTTAVGVSPAGLSVISSFVN